MRSNDSSKTRQKVLARLGRDTDLGVFRCISLWVDLSPVGQNKKSIITP